MVDIKVNEYPDLTPFIKAFYYKNDLRFTPKDGNNAGKELVYGHPILEAELDGKTVSIELKPVRFSDRNALRRLLG